MMMNKNWKVFFAAAAMAGCMSIPAFAAETREEYQAETAVISAELESVEAQLETLKNENKAVSDKYKAICAERKAGGTISVDPDTWDQVKALHQEAAQYRVSKEDVSYKTMRASIKASVTEGNYDAALDTLNQLLDSKKARLDKMIQTNELMEQIDALLGA